MKTNNMIKSLATVSIIALSIFSCASSDTGSATTNTGNEPMAEQTTDAEPMDRTTTGTETMPTDRTTTGPETMGDRTTGTQTQDQSGTMIETDREQLSNPVDYNDMFGDVENTEQYDVLTLARMDENLSTFVQLIEQAGLEQSFNFAEPITLFAPTNEAFQSLSKERYDYLIDPDNREELMSVLQAHVLPTEVSSVAFSNNQRIVDSQGNEIPVDTEMQGNVVFIGGAEIVRSDIAASNGIIHVVNGVIDPSQTADGIGPYDR